MKKAAIWLTIGILVGVVGGYFISSCKDAPLKAENTRLKEEILVQKQRVEWLADEAMKEMDKINAENDILRGENDSLMTVNNDLFTQIGEAHQDSSEAIAAAQALREEVLPAIEANPKLKTYVFNLEKAVKDQSTEIELHMKYEENWKRAYFNSEKINLGLRVEVDKYKDMWTSEKALRQKVELRLNLQDKRVGILSGRLRLTSTGGVLIVAAGLVAILAH